MSVGVWREGLVLSFGDPDSVASEEPPGADVGGAFGDDTAGVAGKAVVPPFVESLGESPELGDEELEGVIVLGWLEEHSPFLEGAVEVVAAEPFGVLHPV
jgi:hypothetical protein